MSRILDRAGRRCRFFPFQVITLFLMATACGRGDERQGLRIKADPDAFLRPFTAEERKCIGKAVSHGDLKQGLEAVAEAIGGAAPGPAAAQLDQLASCASEVTLQRALGGMVARSFPAKAAPGDLGQAKLPASPAEVVAVFQEFPARLADRPRIPAQEMGGPGRYSVTYGRHDVIEPTQSVIADKVTVAGGMDVTDWRSGEHLGIQAIRSAPLLAAGRDGSILWVRCEVGSETVMQALYWGTMDDDWVFEAVATSGEILDELVKAFVTAARKK